MVLVSERVLQGRRIFVQLVITFRHGREEDETLGLSFKKELVLDRVQIYPPEKKKDEETKLQTRLIQKLGEGAFPFSLNFPDLAPNSVIICADEDEDPTNVRHNLNDAGVVLLMLTEDNGRVLRGEGPLGGKCR